MTDPINNSSSQSPQLDPDNTITANLSTSQQTSANVQFVLAMLQMDLAQSNKSLAMDKIDQIKAQQKRSKEFTEAISTLRELGYDFDKYGPAPSLNDVSEHLKQTENALNVIENALPEAKKTGKTVKIDATANNYMFKLGDYPGYEDIRRGNDDLHFEYELNGAKTAMTDRKNMLTSLNDLVTKYGSCLSDAKIAFDKEITAQSIETMIQNLESAQNNVGADIQQQMVYVQDFIGQYNAYTQGSSSALSEASETLKTIARGG